MRSFFRFLQKLTTDYADDTDFFHHRATESTEDTENFALRRCINALLKFKQNPFQSKLWPGLVFDFSAAMRLCLKAVILIGDCTDFEKISFFLGIFKKK